MRARNKIIALCRVYLASLSILVSLRASVLLAQTGAESTPLPTSEMTSTAPSPTGSTEASPSQTPSVESSPTPTIALNPDAKADIQFFGDTYLPSHVLKKTESTNADPKVFSGVDALLKSAKINIVNLEGAATAASIPHEEKQFLLRMPHNAAAILRAANIQVATLANNHSFDFGYPGLFDTLVGLESAGIDTIGAGRNLRDAARPLILPSANGLVCIFAFSRVWPSSFWARENRAGTAYLPVESMANAVRECADSGYFTIVTFHWGEELSKQPQSYQSYLAKQMIDAGARAVIGHHPHVLQPLEIYRGRPILHSLGNFAFGSRPAVNKQEGMAAALHIAQNSNGATELTVVLTPLNVSNTRVNFKPRLLEKNEKDPVATLLPPKHPCLWDKEKRHWVCLFKESQL